MARNKAPSVKPKPMPRQTSKKSENLRLSNAERSAYFARREAAKILQTVLHGDANRQAVASIKSLVYSPSVRNKKATLALVCQTLKHLKIIKDVWEIANVLTSKWKRQEELIYIIAYDILFGKEISFVFGDAEKFVMSRKAAILSALAKLLVRQKVKNIGDLIALYQPPDISKPCYVCVNTLKLDFDSALHELGKQFKGKASSLVAVVLDPKPGWEVLDACSAPGNKTVHLAALMRGKGKIIACERNKDRVKRLEDTIKLSGAANIEVLHGDFLNTEPKDPSFSKVSAILLDPSCSGSGTAAQRLDHLLPSHTTDVVDTERLNKLASFQRRALIHALSFPAVERIVYSTCFVNQIKNEDVVGSVLPLAASHGFQLANAFPQWKRRGLPVVQGCKSYYEPISV